MKQGDLEEKMFKKNKWILIYVHSINNYDIIRRVCVLLGFLMNIAGISVFAEREGLLQFEELVETHLLLLLFFRLGAQNLSPSAVKIYLRRRSLR